MFAERKVIPLHTRAAAEESEASKFGPNEPHMNLRVLWGLAQWVREYRGDSVLEEVAEAADIPTGHLDGRSHWASHDRFEAFLAGCRGLMSSDDQFEEACTHRLPEAYGAMRFALRAVSPRLMYTQAAKSLHMVSAVGSVEVVEDRHNYIRTRYKTTVPESGLMSLSRDAQTKALPTLWGLPPAEVRVAWRDDNGNCEYEVRWQVAPTWLPTLGGVAAGSVVSLAFSSLLSTLPFGLFLFPLVCGAFAHIVDLRRTARLNHGYSSSQREALEELAHEAYEAKSQAIQLGLRQQEWSRFMEQRVERQNRELRSMRERLERIGAERADRDRLRGMSHDLRSPLQLITANLDLLRKKSRDDDMVGTVVTELDKSARAMTAQLTELMTSLTEERFVLDAPVEVVTADLEADLRQRLKAFVDDPGVRTTVFSTREAPASIVVVRLVLDRVLDNLLTNAVKYTDRGSILVEVGGTPGNLTIKVSDTGRGIEEEKLRAVFVPGGSDEETRAENSYGIGLSNVLRLMSEIGGRLEVMSRVGEGSTFWAHFPVEPPTDRRRYESGSHLPYTELVDQVVKIRRT